MKNEISLIIIILVIALLIKLQCVLSNLKSQIPGLILPIVTFILSLFLAFGLVPITESVSTEVQTISEQMDVSTSNDSEENVGMFQRDISALSIVYVLLLINILTVIYLLIYYICKKRKKIYGIKKNAD